MRERILRFLENEIERQRTGSLRLQKTIEQSAKDTTRNEKCSHAPHPWDQLTNDWSHLKEWLDGG